MKKIVLCLLVLLAASAQASHLQKSQHSIQLGGSMNTGNTDTTNINSKIESEIEHFPWGYQASLEGQLGTSLGVETARSLKGNGQINYFLSDRNYVFVQGGVLYDSFATYDLIVREVTGLGRVLLHSTKHELSVQTGPGFIHRRVSGTHDMQNEPIANISGKYTGHLSETAEFKQSVSLDYGRRNTHVEATSAIKTPVVKNLALELSFTISHDTVIPRFSLNTRKTDTATIATLVYSFQ